MPMTVPRSLHRGGKSRPALLIQPGKLEMSIVVKVSLLRDWSLIRGRRGLQNGKIAGPKLFAPPPQDRVKLSAPPPTI